MSCPPLPDIAPPQTAARNLLAPEIADRLSHLFRVSLKNGRIHPLYLPMLRYRADEARTAAIGSSCSCGGNVRRPQGAPVKHRLTRDAVVAGIGRLPPLPQLVHELDAALRSDEVDTNRIVALIARDPALTTAALRLANSPFHGVSGRVVTLRDAVQILGLRTLSSAVMTAAVMASFDRDACIGFDLDDAWRHALATALCAQALAPARGVDECTAYTCGLLHDLGTLALASHHPQAFGASLAWSAAHQVPPLEAEREVLGIDHAEIGGLLAARWRFAPPVVDAIRRHHAPQDDADTGNALLDVLHMADAVTHALDLSSNSDDMVPPLSIAAWERMALGADALQALFDRIERRMRLADAATVR